MPIFLNYLHMDLGISGLFCFSNFILGRIANLPVHIGEFEIANLLF